MRLPDAEVDRGFHCRCQIEDLTNSGCIDLMHPIRNPFFTHDLGNLFCCIAGRAVPGTERTVQHSGIGFSSVQRTVCALKNSQSDDTQQKSVEPALLC